MNSVYDELLAKDTAAQVKELKEKSKMDEDREQEILGRREKARNRKKMWKEWRYDRDKDEEKCIGEKGVHAEAREEKAR